MDPNPCYDETTITAATTITIKVNKGVAKLRKPLPA